MSDDLIQGATTAWKKAAAREEVRSSRLQIANCDIDLHFANHSLEAAYHPALEHLEVENHAAAPDVQIFLWDAAAGVPLPSPPVGLAQLGHHGQIPGLPAHQHATFQSQSGVWSAFDAKQGVGFVAVRGASQLPNYELAAPMRALLGWIGAYHNFVLAHGAAVGTSKGAVLLVGRGGSGKSTTSLNCLLEGLDFLGDDYVAIGTDVTTGAPQVWSLFQSAKVAVPSLELLPALRQGIKCEPTSADDDKFLLFAPDLGRGHVVKMRPLLGILLPVITQECTTTLAPTSKAHALAALGPSTVFQMAGLGAATLAQLTEIVRTLPAYTLHLGADWRSPQLIRHYLGGTEQ